MLETRKSGSSKLTVERVQVIKQLFNFKDITDGDIAALFNVSREQINSIRHYNRWAEVLTPQEELEIITDYYKDKLEMVKAENTKPVRSNDYRDYGGVKSDVVIEQMKLQLIDHICNFR